MKLLVNESTSTIILPRADGGTLKLRPKGQPDDRKEIDDKTAGSEAVQRFLSAKKVSLLSVEEASTRKVAEDRAQKTAPVPEKKKEAPPAPAPKVEPAPEPKPEPKPEPEPVVEEPPAPAEDPESVDDKEEDESAPSTSGKPRKKKKR